MPIGSNMSESSGKTLHVTHQTKNAPLTSNAIALKIASNIASSNSFNGKALDTFNNGNAPNLDGTFFYLHHKFFLFFSNFVTKIQKLERMVKKVEKV